MYTGIFRKRFFPFAFRSKRCAPMIPPRMISIETATINVFIILIFIKYLSCYCFLIKILPFISLLDKPRAFFRAKKAARLLYRAASLFKLSYPRSPFYHPSIAIIFFSGILGASFLGTLRRRTPFSNLAFISCSVRTSPT